MKSRSRKCYAVFAFSLMLIGLALSFVWWVRKEQRQYALNRQLITAVQAVNRCKIAGMSFTPLSAAENINRHNIVALLRKYSKRP